MQLHCKELSRGGAKVSLSSNAALKGSVTASWFYCFLAQLSYQKLANCLAFQSQMHAVTSIGQCACLTIP